MFGFFRRFTRRFVRKSTRISQTPLNRASLVILILVDLFVLFQVFGGLVSVGSFPLSPSETYPCYGAYQSYHTPGDDRPLVDRQVETIRNFLTQPIYPGSSPTSFTPERRLGEVSSLCTEYDGLLKGLDSAENRGLHDRITGLDNNIAIKQREISQLREEYDSTLLEEIAGQTPEASITASTASQTKARIETAEREIDRWKTEITTAKTELLATPSSQAYLKLLDDAGRYETLKQDYEKAEFWHPNLQFLLQLIFLAPLILVTYRWHSQAVLKDWGLQSLLSWHLLLIFCIPLVVRLFEFLQFSNLVQVAVEVVIALVGGLYFIASYLFIILVPLVGFGLIKFLQHFIFNPRVQAKKRIQSHRCIQCNAQLHSDDPFCPHCGFNQFQDCPHCHSQTYQYSPFCRVCGTELPLPKIQ